MLQSAVDSDLRLPRNQSQAAENTLLSEQAEWPTLLTTCGAPLGALSHWVHGALEYLATSWNLHAWPLQRTRNATFDVLSRATPALR